MDLCPICGTRQWGKSAMPKYTTTGIGGFELGTSDLRVHVVIHYKTMTGPWPSTFYFQICMFFSSLNIGALYFIDFICHILLFDIYYYWALEIFTVCMYKNDYNLVLTPTRAPLVYKGGKSRQNFKSLRFTLVD